MLQDLTDDYSTLIRVMAWCRQAIITLANVDKIYLATLIVQNELTLMYEQNNLHSADGVFACLNQYLSISMSTYDPNMPQCNDETGKILRHDL